MDRPGDRPRDVLGPRRLVGPLHVWLGSHDGVAVGQVGLDRDLRADLLAGRDHERRFVGLGVEDPADGVSHPGGGVEVDVCGPPARLGKPIRHPHHGQLLKRQDVGEVLREVGQHRQLGGTGVAEHRRHAVGTRSSKVASRTLGISSVGSLARSHAP